MKHLFKIKENSYLLLIQEDGLCPANRSLKHRAAFANLKVDTRAKSGKYPVEFWVKEDFIFDSMLKLLFNISKN